MSDDYEQWYESQELKGRNMTGVPSPYGQIPGKRGDALREQPSVVPVCDAGHIGCTVEEP